MSERYFERAKITKIIVTTAALEIIAGLCPASTNVPHVNADKARASKRLRKMDERNITVEIKINA
ncbi:hypothetical protein D3C87_1378860 [compost metagenome]